MTCDYLAIPTSLVSSYEGKLEARNNLEDRQWWHSCTFKVEMCIQSWLALLGNVNILLYEDINDAYNSLDVNLEEMMIEDDVIKYLNL